MLDILFDNEHPGFWSCSGYLALGSSHYPVTATLSEENPNTPLSPSLSSSAATTPLSSSAVTMNSSVTFSASLSSWCRQTRLCPRRRWPSLFSSWIPSPRIAGSARSCCWCRQATSVLVVVGLHELVSVLVVFPRLCLRSLSLSSSRRSSNVTFCRRGLFAHSAAVENYRLGRNFAEHTLSVRSTSAGRPAVSVRSAEAVVPWPSKSTIQTPMALDMLQEENEVILEKRKKAKKWRPELGSLRNSTTDLVRSERVMAESDAAESKRRKTEQVEMAKEACLCLMTYGKLMVIKLSNLKEEVDVKDWTCLPPPPFEMFLDLPGHDMCPFEFDSKIYMAPSDKLSLPREIGRAKSLSMGNLVPWPIYEIKFEERRIAPTVSLDGAPFPFRKSYIVNTPGSGDVYLYINLRRRLKDESRFYVLCSGSRVWKPLMAPGAAIISERHVHNTMFVLDNNLFFSSSRNRDYYLARFDPIEETWMDMSAADNTLSNFRKSRLISGGQCRITYFPHISVSLPGLGSSNYTVCLTHEYVKKPPHAPLDKVFAILVNHQNGLVALYQYLDVAFEDIQPPMEEPGRFNFVDLGNGMLCAICSMQLLDSDPYSSAHCFSIFTLSMLKDFAALQLDSGAPPMERDFLQVTVHRKSVFTMENCGLTNYMGHAFVWPPTMGGRFHQRTTPF
ncbi:hypothetical protein Ahy_A01g001222 isoform C [Arachis hypogaea]|uniref:Uncharacterized protein n=1 Tax=Arachis hypogaea TaxID=3818 RepID=A0A445EMF1_ARAHY|nr:hypothetical protein Ahy_A01g001222 isoform C [Arachis hypogaea]